jgi:signal transduction histidine kinase
VVATTGSLAQSKGLSIKTAVADGLPVGRGDERRLTQVLLNLVGNAIKFTDTGEVEICAAAANGTFDVAVRDTGPGIASQDRIRIFEDFQQVDNTSTRLKGGTGLGLAIARRFIEMHGGTLTVDSAIGVGSTFRIRVPVRVNEQRQPQ